jgi:hypothetical protein
MSAEPLQYDFLHRLASELLTSCREGADREVVMNARVVLVLGVWVGACASKGQAGERRWCRERCLPQPLRDADLCRILQRPAMRQSNVRRRGRVVGSARQRRQL